MPKKYKSFFDNHPTILSKK